MYVVKIQHTIYCFVYLCMHIKPLNNLFQDMVNETQGRVQWKKMCLAFTGPGLIPYIQIYSIYIYIYMDNQKNVHFNTNLNFKNTS